MASAPDSSTSTATRDRQERRRARNRAALLDAAREVVREKGVDAATMQDITDVADVGTGTIYNYFDSKMDLLGAVLEDELANLAVSAQTIADEMQDPVRAAACGYWLSVEGVATNPLWQQLLQRPEIVSRTTSGIHRSISADHVRQIRTQFSDTAPTDDEIQTAWWQGLGTIFSLANAVQGGHVTCNEAFLRTATSNILRMFGVPETEVAKAVADPPPPLRRG